MRALRSRLVPLAALLLGCGGEAPFPIPSPAEVERDLGRVENVVAAFEGHLRETLLEGLRAREGARVARALRPGARARVPAPDDGRPVDDAVFAARRWDAPPEDVLTDDEIAARLLEHVRPLETVERAELQVHGFELERPPAAAPFPDHAVADFELRLAGRTAGDGRSDLRLECRAEARLVGGHWALERLDVRRGTLVAGGPPPFRDVTREVGLDFQDSAQNRHYLQAFLDIHRTLALGGLTAVDADGDGFWDVIATRRGQTALLFQNDGQGGFQPRELPFRKPAECGSFVLAADLDGDGAPELVPSQVQGYEGDRAWLDLFTRDGERWERRRRALEVHNPPGLRRVAVTIIAPFDADGDQDLDLFVGVYGDARSRGEHYNTVEAHDGGFNHLLMQGPGLEFTEETAERGITGRQYTYIATTFDFDLDGDADIFEGNDFGPNVLWRNDGSGHFRADDELGLGGVSAYTMGATIADFDGSGRWSLYVSNMSSEEGMRIVPLAEGIDDDMRAKVAEIARGNALYTRDPESGRWIERGLDMECREGEWAWASVFWDPDGDGDRDLFVTNGFASHSDRDLADWQTYYWRQVVADAGFLQRGEPSRNVNPDLPPTGSFNGYERDRVYSLLSGDPRHFYETGYLLGLDSDHDGRCALPLDVDGDGDLDLCVYSLAGLRLYENRSPARRFLRVALRATRTHPLALGAVVEVRAGGRLQRDFVRLLDGFQTQVSPELHFALGGADRIERLEVRWPSGEVERFDDVPVDRRVVLTEGAGALESTPLPRWPDAARPRGGEIDLDRFLRRPSGGNGVAAPAGRAALVVLTEDARPLADLDLPALAARYDCAVSLVVPRGAAAFPRPEGVDLFEADERLLRETAPEGAPVWPTALLFDQDGRLARAWRRPVTTDEAAEVLVHLADEPCYPDLAVEIARLALEHDEVREAERLYLEAIEQDPDNAFAYEGLGRVYRTQGRTEMAEDAFRHSLEADPDHALALYNLAVLYLDASRPAEAVPLLERALELDFDPDRTTLALSEAAYLARDFDRALEAYRASAALAPEDATRALNVAKLLGQMRRLDEAHAAYEAVLELDPGSVEAKRGLQLVERLQQEE